MEAPNRNPYASPTSSTPSSQAPKSRRHGRNIALLIIASSVVGFVLSPADPMSLGIYTAGILTVAGWAYWLGGRQ